MRLQPGVSPAGGIAPPPDLFLALPLYFFLEVSIALTVKIVVILTVLSPILTSILFVGLVTLAEKTSGKEIS